MERACAAQIAYLMALLGISTPATLHTHRGIPVETIKCEGCGTNVTRCWELRESDGPSAKAAIDNFLSTHSHGATLTAMRKHPDFKRHQRLTDVVGSSDRTAPLPRTHVATLHGQLLYRNGAEPRDLRWTIAFYPHNHNQRRPELSQPQSPQNNLAKEGVERHRVVLRTRGLPSSCFLRWKTDGFRRGFRQRFVRQDHDTARYFLALESVGMNQICAATDTHKRHDTITILSFVQL